MHLRRIAAFVLGAWLAGSLLVGVVCLNNSSGVDEAMGSTGAEARQVIAHAGGASAKMFLGYLTAIESNHLLSGWELMQAPIGLLAILLLFLERPSRLLVVLPVVMLLLVSFEHMLITPEIAWLSKELAFVPDSTGIVARAHLDNMRRIYGFAETAKMLVGAGLAVLLFTMRSGRRSRRSSRVDLDEFVERRTAV